MFRDNTSCTSMSAVALDPASCFLRFLSPSMQQPQQCALVDRELFQRLALDARHDTGNEPARQAHLNDRNQRAVRFEGGEGSAQIVQLLHGGAPSVHISDDGMQYSRRRPIASSIMGFEDEVLKGLKKRRFKLKDDIATRLWREPTQRHARLSGPRDAPSA
jgi:hypothetical protein